MKNNKLRTILTKAFILYNCEIQIFTLLALQAVKFSGHDYWFNWKKKSTTMLGLRSMTEGGTATLRLRTRGDEAQQNPLL